MAGTAAGAAKARATRAARVAGAKAPADHKAPRVRKTRPEELGEASPPAAVGDVIAEAAEHDDDLPDDGSCRVGFNGYVFDVKSPGDWRNSAQEALANGLFATWSTGAMYPKSAACWAKADFTNRECFAFMEAFDAAFRARYGDDPKAMQQRIASSGSTPRR